MLLIGYIIPALIVPRQWSGKKPSMVKFRFEKGRKAFFQSVEPELSYFTIYIYSKHSYARSINYPELWALLTCGVPKNFPSTCEAWMSLFHLLQTSLRSINHPKLWAMLTFGGTSFIYVSTWTADEATLYSPELHRETCKSIMNFLLDKVDTDMHKMPTQLDLSGISSPVQWCNMTCRLLCTRAVTFWCKL